MNKDLLYIFDKTTFKREQLGEIQKDFNMSFVIDGTKDTAKVIVWSFNSNEVEPNTICLHAKTNTWWIVQRDKVERYLNDDNTFIYEHNLQLLGAIELLNARDLTDCGFNQNEYTCYQFIQRLFKLSNFEFYLTFSNTNYNFRNKLVDYVKTFENYTLLSALREFLDGYNMCGKLSFNVMQDGNNYYIDYAILDILSKTGNFELTAHDIDEFDDVRETKVLNRDSFGTTVISNAENVISSISKTFPSTGSIRPSGTEYNVKAENGVIRLPSKVFKGNWLKIVFPWCLVEVVGEALMGVVDLDISSPMLNIQYGNSKSLEKGIQLIIDKVANSGDADFYEEFISAFTNELPRIKREILLAGCATLYNGNELNPITGDIVKGANVPYLVEVEFIAKNLAPNGYYIFCDEETKNTLPIKYQGIQWKRGSNEITGFDAFIPDAGRSGSINISSAKGTDLQSIYPNQLAPVIFKFEGNTGNLTIKFDMAAGRGRMHFTGGFNLPPAIHFIVNYVPMADIKVKIDNQQNKRDIQLYNQNGKLTDNIALSKIINSYSKEISSDSITRYMQYRSFDGVPKVGCFVNTSNGEYIVNNVSLDITQNEYTNEDFGYYIEAEITMSKYCATKSLMVNPNQNIRDYGIPQNFNVKRKQLYRDYYELSYTTDPNADTNYYLKPRQVFNIGERPNTLEDLTCVIKLSYAEQVENSYDWYYQLETTTYNMNKMFYLVCDFNDNNIIGYSNQNVWSGFSISRIFAQQYDSVNCPISYVDSKGEVKDICIKLCNNEQLTNVYDIYQQSQTGGDTYEGSLYNYSCFIPSEIYEWLGSEDYTMIIEEPNYDKDAIEVPVFEYACQVEDSDDVLIGDNILTTRKENVIYMYSFVKGEHLTQNNALPTEHISYNADNYTATLENAVSVNFGLFDEAYIYLTLLEEKYYYTDDDGFGNYGTQSFEPNKDYAIFRHTFDLETNQETNVDLIFIAKKVQPRALNSIVDIVINHWKLN
ncbi:MAG: hypothetical protein J6S85_07395 [Methanobrevibacter sp.]|nr:hypothetical protein [Methanobrevibacter sp.]